MNHNKRSICSNNMAKSLMNPNTLFERSFDSLPLESIKSDSVFTTSTLPDSSSDLSTNSDIEFHDYINLYLNILKIETNFNDITYKFEQSIYESMDKSTNCMIPCFNVAWNKGENLPSGSFAVIDIGGSTLRVSIVEFLENKSAKCIVNKSWAIEDNNKHLDKSFFKWAVANFKSLITTSLRSTLEDSEGNIKVGITWSFPMIQHVAPNRGIVSNLGKGFTICDDFKGKDLKDIFENCFTELELPIKVYAIINDSISVFVTGSYFNHAKIGLVQGTGVNSCFIIEPSLLGETKRNILKHVDDGTKILVNTEASFLGHHLAEYICTTDKEMNNLWELMGRKSVLPPHLTTESYGVFQPLEIITAGRYIPEIIRRIFVERKSSTVQISLKSPHYSLTAEFLAGLYHCKNLEVFKKELEKNIMVENITIEDLNILKIITQTVIYRASLILSSYIIALIRVTKFTELQELEISVVGSMLQFFPGYKETVLEILDAERLKYKLPKISFDFIKDSSIYGASIAAFVNQQRLNL